LFGFRITQYIPRFGGVLQECGDITWRLSDCEELVGVAHRRWWGWFLGVIFEPLPIHHGR